MLKNKHIVAAVIIAPVLALIGYFATDQVVSEVPMAAASGASYPLAAKPNCRYSSGVCTLYNGDLKIDLQLSDAGSLNLASSAPLNAVEISIQFTDSSVEEKMQLTSMSSDLKRWQTPLNQPAQSTDVLRLVISASQSLFYAETTLEFLEYKTIYGKDFKRD